MLSYHSQALLPVHKEEGSGELRIQWLSERNAIMYVVQMELH